MTQSPKIETKPTKKKIIKKDIVIRFAGDSGDGMQLTGSQFTLTSAIAGNDIVTFPDFPAEIRAPAGTVAGVSGFQLHFSSTHIFTPGDQPEILIAMNPAALKANIKDLPKNGVLIINSDAFIEANLTKAGYTEDPRKSGIHGDLATKYQFIEVPINKLTEEALLEHNLSPKIVDRCKNFFALGLCYWLFTKDMQPTIDWINEKFQKTKDISEANLAALHAGYNFGDVTELFTFTYEVEKAHLPPGKYRNITGNIAIALGAMAAAENVGLELFLGSYPITPATDILHELSKYKHLKVRTFQAEDEIAGICSAIGASYAGSLALTTTSGPGLALKQEALNLAMKTELPLVVVNVQRGGPSTGLPTKTEQADLLQAMYGRNGESPLIVLAANSPAHCFEVAYEAFQLTLKYMTPVIVLTDGYIANGSEPWLIPDLKSLPELKNTIINTPKKPDEKFLPFSRNENMARPWVRLGTEGYEHRIGGIEGEKLTGAVCYDPQNHSDMVHERQDKVDKVAESYPPTKIEGKIDADLCLLGWGSTYGSITAAREALASEGTEIAQIHLTHLNPLPNDLEGILRKYKTVLIPEMNMGQLRFLIQGKFGMKTKGLTKITGQPFRIAEIEEAVIAALKE
jgi:2-oxoglutarate ferredoxin oxidoreductase subunit alpha